LIFLFLLDFFPTNPQIYLSKEHPYSLDFQNLGIETEFTPFFNLFLTVLIQAATFLIFGMSITLQLFPGQIRQMIFYSFPVYLNC